MTFLLYTHLSHQNLSQLVCDGKASDNWRALDTFIKNAFQRDIFDDYLGCVSKVSRAEQLCKPDKASCQIYHAQEAPCKLLETHSHSTIILDFHKEALYQVALLVVEIITFPRL